jgi:hypothetical protein
MYKPVDNFVYMSVKNCIWGIIGLILGVIINNIVIYLSNTLHIKLLFVQNIIQIFLCSIILSTINIYHNYFGWTWQNATPGLFFISFFFGVQYKILSNIQHSYILDSY